MQRGFSPIFLLIILVVILGIAGVLYFKTQPKPPSPKNPQASISPQPSDPNFALPSPSFNPENIDAVKADLKLNYFFNPKNDQTRILKMADFNSGKIKEITLPYDKSIRKYVLSPDEKYILKLTEKQLEIAPISENLNFKTIFTVPKVTDPKFPDRDFAYLGDAAWDNSGKLYFITSVGLDGIGAPEGGVYTDLYSANADGSNVKLINDHTKEDQQYGFMKSFAYFDKAKNQVYFSGRAHGGHFAPMIIVDSVSGKLISTMRDIYTDIQNPVFNSDFSKAYFMQDFNEKGYLTPVKIYEYDTASKSKKVIYTIPNPTADIAPGIASSNGFYHHNNSLFFAVEKTYDELDFYQLDPSNPTKPKLIYSGGNCFLEGISKTSDYLFMECIKEGSKNFFIYQISSGKRFDFYTDNSSPSAYPYPDDTINILSFK